MIPVTLSPSTFAPAAMPSNIVAALAQILRGDAQAFAADVDASATDTALARPGSILNLLLNPKNGAALMDINLDQLVNNSALQTLIRQLPPELLSNPQVFEALVLQNALLPSASPPESLPAQPLLILPDMLNPAIPPYSGAETPALYRITLQWQNRLLQVLSPQAFANGSRLQLQSNAQGEIALLPKANASAASATDRTSSTPLEPPAAGPPVAQTPSPLQTLQQSARTLLPRQEALHTLVPLLQKFLAPTTQAQLPPPVAKAIAQLLRSLPQPEQLQDPAELRQAVERSGSFFENRLLSAQDNAGRTPDAVAKLVATDFKAQIIALLAAIRSATPSALNRVRAQAPIQTDTDEFVYTNKPAAHNAPALAAPREVGSDPADTLLTQLGKLLQSGLARIEMNQVESATARHVGNDAQPPVPTWLLEVPVRTAFGADQLRLRIEQRRNKKQGATRQQWNVDIALDLHAAGKLAATLTIVDKSVAATLWVEREQTHRAVRDEIAHLRAGLESVGVNVTAMQCRLGVPPVRSSAVTQRLVDVHT